MPQHGDRADVRVAPREVAETRPARASPSTPVLGALFLVALIAVFTTITRDRPPAFEWASVDLPPGPLNIDSLVATSTGFAIASGPGEYGAVWTTGDASDWSALSLPRAPTKIVADGPDLVGYDTRTAFRITPAGGVTELRLPDLLRTGYGSGRAGLVPGPGGMIAQTVMGDVYRSHQDDPFRFIINASRWRTAVDISIDSRCSPAERTGPDLPPVVSTREGFFAFVAADDASGVWPICEPVTWTSGDGSIWKQESLESPFGPGAFIADVASNGSGFVAVGGTGIGRPSVWVSGDALTWTGVMLPASDHSYELIEVRAGGLGFVAVGRFTDRPGHINWISTDGSCWEPLPESINGRAVAVGDGSILITDRTHPATAWLGSPTSPVASTRCIPTM